MKGRRRMPERVADEAPVVVPHVIITVTGDGGLDVTVDGTPFPPPPDAPKWTRSTLGRLLDAITNDRTVTVRIEVRETDGSVFTDLIQAHAPKQSEPPAPRLPKTRRNHTRRPGQVEVAYEGFVPGEDVMVALIVAHTDATGTGRARALVDTSHLADLLDKGTGEVVLLGRVSGTLHVRRLS
jgi:hypothetical protein